MVLRKQKCPVRVKSRQRQTLTVVIGNTYHLSHILGELYILQLQQLLPRYTTIMAGPSMKSSGHNKGLAF